MSLHLFNRSFYLYILLLLLMVFTSSSEAFSKSFVNTSMLDMRPTFVVNFDMSTVICQHSADAQDLHLHDISILCDGKMDCYDNPAMHDESFPYCEGKCNSTCSNRGACLYDGENAQCYCNSGTHGKMCELPDVNECADKPCHWLAHCKNTYGFYKCQCFTGFKGDGFHCSDIDECAEGIAQCPLHSTCVNLPGTYLCNCTNGYAQKGIPVDKCVAMLNKTMSKFYAFLIFYSSGAEPPPRSRLIPE
uniref:EGF-like domain-containing protein n=1 Tax=Ditylenchus dipsaci TaxID=166011 RepID=A0A915CUE3_9BILA